MNHLPSSVVVVCRHLFDLGMMVVCIRASLHCTVCPPAECGQAQMCTYAPLWWCSCWLHDTNGDEGHEVASWGSQLKAAADAAWCLKGICFLTVLLYNRLVHVSSHSMFSCADMLLCEHCLQPLQSYSKCASSISYADQHDFRELFFFPAHFFGLEHLCVVPLAIMYISPAVA